MVKSMLFFLSVFVRRKTVYSSRYIYILKYTFGI